MGLRHFKIGLISLKTGAAIQEAGGTCFVAVQGAANKATLFKADGSALANPIALANGEIEFWTLDTVASVDLYIQAPSGHFLTAKKVVASGPTAFYIDKSDAKAVMVIPVAAVDQTADATETSTGFSLIAGSVVLPVAAGLSLEVLTVQAGKTVDFGTAEAIAETGGDADGMASALSTTTATTVLSAVATGVVVTTHTTITSTFSAGSTVAAGFLKIPVILPVAAL